MLYTLTLYVYSAAGRSHTAIEFNTLRVLRDTSSWPLILTQHSNDAHPQTINVHSGLLAGVTTQAPRFFFADALQSSVAALG